MDMSTLALEGAPAGPMHSPRVTTLANWFRRSHALLGLCGNERELNAPPDRLTPWWYHDSAQSFSSLFLWQGLLNDPRQARRASSGRGSAYGYGNESQGHMESAVTAKFGMVYVLCTAFEDLFNDTEGSKLFADETTGATPPTSPRSSKQQTLRTDRFRSVVPQSCEYLKGIDAVEAFEVARQMVPKPEDDALRFTPAERQLWRLVGSLLAAHGNDAAGASKETKSTSDKKEEKNSIKFDRKYTQGLQERLSKLKPIYERFRGAYLRIRDYRRTVLTKLASVPKSSPFWEFTTVLAASKDERIWKSISGHGSCLLPCTEDDRSLFQPQDVFELTSDVALLVSARAAMAKAVVPVFGGNVAAGVAGSQYNGNSRKSPLGSVDLEGLFYFGDDEGTFDMRQMMAELQTLLKEAVGTDPSTAKNKSATSSTSSTAKNTASTSSSTAGNNPNTNRNKKKNKYKSSTPGASESSGKNETSRQTTPRSQAGPAPTNPNAAPSTGQAEQQFSEEEQADIQKVLELTMREPGISVREMGQILGFTAKRLKQARKNAGLV
ncbi:unnamed protein product [Amoebophrya sp. A25]|nr:unnamed protein product [Amoebophrya sp. A25]|eukprot:GSA25T00017636001.1